MRTFAERRAAAYLVLEITEAHRREAEMVRFLLDHPEYTNTTGDLLATVLSCEGFTEGEAEGISRLDAAHAHKTVCARCPRIFDSALRAKRRLMGV